MKKLFIISTMLLLLAGNSSMAQKNKTKKTVAETTGTAKEQVIAVTPEEGKEVVAIYPFTCSGRTYYDYALNAGNAVEGGFVRSKRFTVVERSRFNIVKDEELFKEANTNEVVNKARKLGAKYVVTGNVMSATEGTQSTPIPGFPGVNYIAQLQMNFKLIEVETGTILKDEPVLGKGKGGTPSEAMHASYIDMDRQSRVFVAQYLPQRFDYASDVEVDKKNRLKKFKIWGGSDQGLKEKDVVEIYRLSYTTSPRTGKKVEEKKLVGTAKIIEINSIESATCELQKSNDIGESILQEIKSTPEAIVFEYKGTAKSGGLNL